MKTNKMAVKLERVSFEDALTMTGFGRYNHLTWLLCASAIMGMTFESMSVAYLVPASACELDTTSAQQGLIAAIPLFSTLTSHFWGYLADTKGRKKILSISMLSGFISGAAAAISPNWIVLCLLKLLSSCSVTSSLALAVTLISESTPQAKRNTTIIQSVTVFLFSNGLMAVIAIPVLRLTFSYHVSFLNIHFNSWRLLNLIFSLPCAISFFGLFFSYESPKYLLSIGDHNKAMQVLREIYVINTKTNGESYMVNSIYLDEQSARKHPGFWASVVDQTMPLLKLPLLKNTLLLSTLFGINYFCLHPFLIWLPFMADGFMRAVDLGASGMTYCSMFRLSQNNTVIQEDNCALNEIAMTMVFCTGVFLTIMYVIISHIVNYFGRKRIVLFIEFSAFMSALCINLTTSLPLIVIFFMFYMCGCLSIGPLSIICVDAFPTYLRAMAVSLTMMVGRACAIAGVNLHKRLLDYNCEATFYIFGSVMLFGGLIGFLLPNDRRKAHEDPET